MMHDLLYTMQSHEKYPLLRSLLRAIGLSSEAIDDIVERINDFLSDKHDDKQSVAQQVYPYFVRDDFLSRAEMSFYLILKNAVSEWALVCPKVSLGDLFYAKSQDNSLHRTLTNKIDRKHVDFLLCDPKTVRPILGIELDDKSHQRSDRQARDEFVQEVFAAANLPLARIPVHQAYATAQLNALLRQQAGLSDPVSQSKIEPVEPVVTTPCCPKCGTEMVLRTAKTGANAGGRFWGCPDYPRCRGILNYEPTSAIVNP